MSTRLTGVKIPFDKITGEYIWELSGKNGCERHFKYLDTLKGEYSPRPPGWAHTYYYCPVEGKYKEYPEEEADKIKAAAKAELDEWEANVASGRIQRFSYVEWKPDHVFEDELTFDNCNRGGENRFIFYNKRGRKVCMSSASLAELIKNSDIISGKVKGRFHYVKKGPSTSVAPYYD